MPDFEMERKKTSESFHVVNGRGPTESLACLGPPTHSRRSAHSSDVSVVLLPGGKITQLSFFFQEEKSKGDDLINKSIIIDLFKNFGWNSFLRFLFLLFY